MTQKITLHYSHLFFDIWQYIDRRVTSVVGIGIPPAVMMVAMIALQLQSECCLVEILTRFGLKDSRAEQLS